MVETLNAQRSYESYFFEAVLLLNQQYGEYISLLANLSAETEKETVIQAMVIMRTSCIKVVSLGAGLTGKVEKELRDSLKEAQLTFVTIEKVLDWANAYCASRNPERMVENAFGGPKK